MTDAHLHLHFEALRPHWAEIFEVYERLGVRRVVTNGTSPSDWHAVEELAEAHGMVLPSFGLHPWHVNGAPRDWMEKLEAFLERHPEAGVGECGLDKWILDHDLDAQESAFRYQIGLAAAGNRPLSIHCLQCWGRMLDVLGDEALPERGFLLHAYGGPAELVDAFAELGAFFSFNGYFLRERKAGQVEIFKRVPLDRLLVETDAPDMHLPDAFRRFSIPAEGDAEAPNHPGNLASTMVAATEILGLEEGRGDESFDRFFGSMAKT